MELKNERTNEIDSEIKFLSLFNYKLIGPDGSNRWIIIDENGDNIGYIQKKKIHNKNIKKGKEAVYGYVMSADSDLIKYERTRKIQSEDDKKKLCNNDYKYDFKIKVSDSEYAYVELDLSNFYPSINIWSKEYEYINFNIANEDLFLNYRSKTDNYNIEEVVSIHDGRTTISYNYSISYCCKDSNIDKQGTTLSIAFTKSKHNENDPLKIRILTWKDNKLINDYYLECVGSIEDAILKHEMGIESLNHFKYLIDRIIPSSINIVEVIKSSIQINENSIIALFLEKEEDYSKKLKKN